MKKICFVKMEGVLTSFADYVPDEEKVKKFLSDLKAFCKKNKIELFLISGHNKSIADGKFSSLKLNDFFDKDKFFCVNEEYISNKSADDAKLHRQSLEADPFFVDSFFKQVIIKEILEKKSVSPSDVLLLCNDLWVDAYYSQRFSKIDFALFEENICDRGKKASPLSGLAYFSLSTDSVSLLLKDFPQADTSSLDKYVFDEMKKVLIGSSFKDAVVKGLKKKMETIR